MNWLNDIFSEVMVVYAVGLLVFTVGGLLKLGNWLYKRAERRAAEERWMNEQLRVMGYLLERQRERLQRINTTLDQRQGEPKDSIGE